MAGQRQKHPDALVFRRGGRVKSLEVVDPEIEAPEFDPPDGLRADALVIWDQTMELARAHLMPTDIFAARRWIHWVNEWLKSVEVLGDRPLVMGSAGIVVNPIVRYIRECETKIEHAETVMGLTPLARMRLGITYAMEQSALAALKSGQPTKPRLMDAEPAPKPRKARA